MSRQERPAGKENGMVLPLALLALLSLSVLALSFTSMSAMEPQVPRNLTEASRARYLADSGVEWAFDQLAAAPPTGPGSWNEILKNGGKLATDQTLPGLTAAYGTFTVFVRNDNRPGDDQITGLPVDLGDDKTDTNGILILTSTATLNAGTPNQVERQIQVVMQVIQVPPLPGAVNMPGLQADVTFFNGTVDVDGRDWMRDKNGSYSLNPDQSKMKYGMAVQAGIQKDVGATYKKRAEDGFTIPGYANKIRGKSQNGGGLTTGVNTISADSSLHPAVVYKFLNQLKRLPTTTLLPSSKQCQAQLIGNPNDPTKPTLSYKGPAPKCPPKQTLHLGTPDNPKVVFFNAGRDSNGAFLGLGTYGADIKGAGILVMLDGDISTFNKFHWDGILVIAGHHVGLDVRAQGMMVYGGVIIMEVDSKENSNNKRYRPYGYMGDFNIDGAASGTFHNSSQNIAMAQNLSILKRLWGWREI